MIITLIIVGDIILIAVIVVLLTLTRRAIRDHIAATEVQEALTEQTRRAIRPARDPVVALNYQKRADDAIEDLLERADEYGAPRARELRIAHELLKSKRLILNLHAASGNEPTEEERDEILILESRVSTLHDIVAAQLAEHD